MANTDERNEVIEQAELAAAYYEALLRQGIPQSIAVQLATAWILSQRKTEPDQPIDPTRGF